jgi:hypothetical protein
VKVTVFALKSTFRLFPQDCFHLIALNIFVEMPLRYFLFVLTLSKQVSVLLAFLAKLMARHENQMNAYVAENP